MDSLNTSEFTTEEVHQARSGLQLLKQRMANRGGMNQRRGTEHTNNVDNRSYQNQSYMGGQVGPSSTSVGGSSTYSMPQNQGAPPQHQPQRRLTYGNNPSHQASSANKPPMMPPGGGYHGYGHGENQELNTSNISGIGNNGHNGYGQGQGYGGGTPNRATPRGMGSTRQSNYRRVFKPQLTPAAVASSGAFSTLNSEDHRGGNGHSGQTHSNNFYENPVVNRQSLNHQQFSSDSGNRQPQNNNRAPQTFYEPSRKSPNAMRRQISQNRENEPSGNSAGINNHSRIMQNSNLHTDNRNQESRNGYGALSSNSHKRPSHMQNGSHNLPQQHQRQYQSQGNGQGGQPAYDSRKYSGMPQQPQNERQPLHDENGGGIKRSGTYQFGGQGQARRPSPMKYVQPPPLSQKPDLDRSAANDHPDPFNQGGNRMQHSPPKQKAVRPNPMTMKSQPKQSPQNSFGSGNQQNAIDQYNNQMSHQPHPPQKQPSMSIQRGPNDPPMYAENAGQDNRVPCDICGRKFNPDALERHQRICAKSKAALDKRQAFDAKEQRLIDSPEIVNPKKAAQNSRQSAVSKPEDRVVAGKKMPKWKLQSLQFRKAMMTSNPDAPPVSDKVAQELAAVEEIDDRIQCKWCNRKFNKEAGERHFKFCEEQYKKNLMKNGGKLNKQNTKRGTQSGFMKKKAY